jgi:hypothetical protein
VQLYVPALISEGEIPPAPGAKGFGGGGKTASSTGEGVKPPVWLGKDYQLQCQLTSTAPVGQGRRDGTWQRGHWRVLSPLADPVAAPLEWVEPLLLAP